MSGRGNVHPVRLPTKGGRWRGYRDAGLAVMHRAQGTEAGTAETVGPGPKDDGPVADKPCAQTAPERN